MRARCAIPARAAAGASAASSTASAPSSELGERAPASATITNGTASAGASSCPCFHDQPPRPSRYNTISTVRGWVIGAAGRLILPGHGFTPAHGFPLLSLANTTVLRAAAGSVLYLALIALLSLGISTAVRDSAVAVGIVLGLLYLFPIIANVVSDEQWHRHLEQIGPMTAGLAIQATTDLSSLRISPWAGLGVLAAWAGGALLAGGLVLRLRDA